MDRSEPEADYGPNPDSEEEQAELEEQPGYSNAGVSTPSDAGTMPQRSEGVSFASFDRWQIRFRRDTLDCRVFVFKKRGSEKYSLVPKEYWESTTEYTSILDARTKVIMETVKDIGHKGDIPREIAIKILEATGHVSIATGEDGKLYEVLDYRLHQQVKHSLFLQWYHTPEGQVRFWRWKRPSRNDGRWTGPGKCSKEKISCYSSSGRFVIPRHAKSKWRNFCDKTYGGQQWVDALIQLGDCPVEFVRAWNDEIDKRLEAIMYPMLDCALPAGHPRLRDLPEEYHERPAAYKKRSKMCTLHARVLERRAHATWPSRQAQADFDDANVKRDQARIADFQKILIQIEPQRACHHPATHYTEQFSGAEICESPILYPRALCTTLKKLGVDGPKVCQLLNIGGQGKVRTW